MGPRIIRTTLQPIGGDKTWVPGEGHLGRRRRAEGDPERRQSLTLEDRETERPAKAAFNRWRCRLVVATPLATARGGARLTRPAGSGRRLFRLAAVGRSAATGRTTLLAATAAARRFTWFGRASFFGSEATAGGALLGSQTAAADSLARECPASRRVRGGNRKTHGAREVRGQSDHAAEPAPHRLPVDLPP
jgi:hypothetical protein